MANDTEQLDFVMPKTVMGTLNADRNQISCSNVLSVAQSLALALQQVGPIAPEPDIETATAIRNWIEGFRKRQDDVDGSQQLETDKDALANQVRNMDRQLQTQNEKLVGLENKLSDQVALLNNTEQLLQREVLLRSSLETQKFELMTALSELNLQKATIEKELFEIKQNQAINKVTKPSLPCGEDNLNHSSPLNGSFHGSIGNMQRSNMLLSSTPKTPQGYSRHKIGTHFNTLPRSSANNTSYTSWHEVQVGPVDNNANHQPQSVSFATPEKLVRELNGSLGLQDTTPTSSFKSKGLKHFFGKMRRSSSGNLEDLTNEDEFRRGGIRATASPRLGWSSVAKSSKQFKDWNVNDICIWFEEIGLDCYESGARRWLKGGAKDLLESSPVDIDKELNLKSPLHRKKIVLALADISGKDKDELFINAGKLNNAWTIKWLDDAGLPQLKDFFVTSKMDGRMLHKLTMDDLSVIHLQSCLHLASLRRGIQVMRECKWDSSCLIRRSSGDSITNEPVELWTSHRVMEWLRAIDLAEYVPNLRGAGVHGGLMKYEPRFTAELLADLLSIPQNKTLLRRHLATHFNNLLGRDIIQTKREIENTLGYQPLTMASKIKTPRKTQFSLKRKKSTKTVEEWSDYVCPMGQSDEESRTERTSRGRSCLSSS